MINFLKLKDIFLKFLQPLRATQDLLINNQFKNDLINPKNPFNRFGKRCFSQCDEDGISLEIVKRLNIKKGIFCEIGCDTGLQNNTLILASLLWNGIWIDKSDLVIDYNKFKRLKFFKETVTTSNIVGLIKGGLTNFISKELDCISIDIDSCDYHIVETILKNSIFPKFFIVEINQKFPPPIEFVADNDAKTIYNKDYYGASLYSFYKLFSKYNYTLICCSLIMGHNAFFIQNKYLDLFKDVPKDINDIYITPNYWSFSHSFKTGSTKEMVEAIFKD